MSRFGHGDQLPSDEELRLFSQKWPGLQQVRLTPEELISYLREAVELVQTGRRKAAELEEKRRDARAVLRAALSDFQASSQLEGSKRVACRVALAAAIESARTAFRHQFAGARKRRTQAVITQLRSSSHQDEPERVLRQIALSTAPILVLDKECGLDRGTNALTWGGVLDPVPGDEQLVILANEVENRFAALEHCL